jgi:hypothetical protein
MNGGGGDKKVIKINTDLFKFNSNTTRKAAPVKKDPKPIKIKSVNRDKTIKRDMLRRIRANQAEQYNKIFGGGGDEPVRVSAEEKFDSGFNETMEFMNKLVDKQKREQAPHNQTLRAPVHVSNIYPQPQQSQPMVQQPQSIPMVQPQQMVHQPQPIPMVHPIPIVQPQQMVHQQPFFHIGGSPQTIVPKLVHPEPPKFGCLKNGSLPTFRANKTVRNETVHNGGSGQGLSLIHI